MSGFKSIGDPIELEIKPLTLISGVNSSGKSSFMQPFLMLKQTLEAPYDPGPLLLNGPNVRLTEWGQALSRQKARARTTKELQIGVDVSGLSISNTYDWSPSNGLSLVATDYGSNADHDGYHLGFNMGHAALEEQIDSIAKERLDSLASILSGDRQLGEEASPKTVKDIARFELQVRRRQAFLTISATMSEGRTTRRTELPFEGVSPQTAAQAITSIIHVPGLRGNPERIYESSVVGQSYAGTFDRYVASAVYSWQNSGDAGQAKLRTLWSYLRRLQLTWKVEARQINDVQVELRVGRMMAAQQGGAHDTVNIADVGFGVSQTLPVLVALLAARPGQTVYLEQPEIHLHPRAQLELGKVLAEVARRGVVIVAETHSSLILRAIQTAVARGSISSEDVGLNWFSRNPDSGFSVLDVAEVGTTGDFGDWPVDFDEVSEIADWTYLTTVEEAMGASE